MGPLHERTRPRVDGERQDEILTAALDLLSEVGYDRLTMDAVAARAKAGKATLYRRWSTKADLVVDAVSRATCLPCPEQADTGSLRGDLLAAACGVGGVADQLPLAVMASLITALHRDADLSAAFHRSFLAPRIQRSRELFDRAAARGELAEGRDPELLATVLPSMVIHRLFILGQQADAALVERIVDEVVLPACRAG